MKTGSKQIRLGLLVNHLQKGRWRKLPSHVGLKTALIAQDLELIEARGDDLRQRAYRLTPVGHAYLRKYNPT